MFAILLRTLVIGTGLALFASPVEAEEPLKAEVSAIRAALDSKNFEEAAKLLKPLADSGHPASKTALAELYFKGQGVERNSTKAIKLLSESADLGDAEAQFYLGMLYQDGDGVPANEKKAAHYFLLAAEQGVAEAQFALGVILSPGTFEGEPAKISLLGRKNSDPLKVPDDAVASAYWYRKAAMQGLSSAQYNLAISYHHGRGVPQNLSEAYRYYKLAALQGDALAQTNLAVLYEHGEGVTKSVQSAYMWSLIAAAAGNSNAERNRDIYANELSPQSRAVAQEKAKSCLQSEFTRCD